MRGMLLPGALLVAVALLSGCAAPGAPVPAPTSPSASEASTPGPSIGELEPVDPTAEWQTVRPGSGRTQFRIPADWTADVSFQEIDGDAVDGVVIRRPDGQQQLGLSQAPGDVGGICEAIPAGVLLDSEPLSLGSEHQWMSGGPAFGAVAVQLGDGRWVFGMGITGEERLREPLSCPFYFITGGPGELGGILSFGTESQLTGTGAGSVWVVDSLDDARAYLETEEYATLKQILLSLEYLV